MTLSKNFTLSEFLRSEAASRRGIVMHPNQGAIDNMKFLCEHVLEPIRAQAGRIRITSGFRSLSVNEMVGGSPTSAHLYGLAADTEPMDIDFDDYGRIIRRLVHSLPVAKVILEFGEWYHIEAPKEGVEATRQLLVAERYEDKTIYRTWT